MCNRYANKVTFTDINDRLVAMGIDLVTGGAIPNLEPRDNIYPTNQAPVIRGNAERVELVQLRWWLIPWFHKGTIKEWKAMTTNARVETAATTRTFKKAFEKQRCLVPVSYFYEWTGAKGEKTKWAFSRPDGAWFCFVGLWDGAVTADGPIGSFTLLTTAAGPDMQAYHSRQPVILQPEDYGPWLSDALLDSAALRPAAGQLAAAKATT